MPYVKPDKTKIKGKIAISADFPVLQNRHDGDLYLVTGTVTDTLVTPNQSFTSGQEIVWLESDGVWNLMGDSSASDAHAARTDNPHAVNKSQVGLSNVTNVAQLPASALDDTSTDGSHVFSAQKIIQHTGNTSNPHSVSKSQVGLGSVDNVQQMPLSYLETDASLASNSDARTPSTKALRTYINNTVETETARRLATRLDVATTVMKLLPPEIVDYTNGDILPPLRPDGTYGYNMADPYIEFTLTDGKIDGGAAVAPWAADLVGTNAETMGIIQRDEDGAYQLKKGSERLNSTVTTYSKIASLSNTFNAHQIIFGKRKQNEMAVAGLITGLNNVALYANSGAVHRVRPILLNGTNEPPTAADIVYVGDWTNYSGTGAATKNTNLPINNYSVAAGAKIRAAVEAEYVSGSGSNSVFYVGHSDVTQTDASKWTQVTGDAAYRDDGDGTIDSLSASYDLAADITFTTDTELTRPTADADTEIVALIGSESYPYKQGSTTTLVMRKYSEVSTDTYDSAPTSVQCPVCMKI